MKFELDKSTQILSRTPEVLKALLSGLSPEWIKNNEGEDTWSPYDVIGHLIHCEKTDWMVRAKIIMSNIGDKTFEPFDRFAQMNQSQDRSIDELLDEFKERRQANLIDLGNLQIQHADLSNSGIHPALGEVELQHLLSSWVVHDLGHITQISRVMAKQYKTEVGPWAEYLSILKM